LYLLTSLLSFYGAAQFRIAVDAQQPDNGRDLAVTKKEKARCYAIKGRDLKNLCPAQVGNKKSRRYGIKDRDQKQRCLAEF
jgi:hypothetical protein